jgi:hypothetical protein
MATRRRLKNISRLIDIAKDELPIEEAFLDSLKKSIETEEAANKKKPSLSYKPSGMKCLRSMYYERTGVDPDKRITPYTLVGICNSGTDTHLRIQTAVDHMKNYGFDCEYVDVEKFVKSRKIKDLEIVEKSGMETKLFSPKYNIRFLCDGIIKWEGHYYILELKTETSFKWDTRIGVAEEHYNQAITYSLLLGLPEVIFVYINRNNLDMKAYMFKPTDDMKQNLIGMIENCEGYVKRGITPPKSEDIEKKFCEYYCQYKTLCRKEK